jgi:hypothetical protein
MKFNLATILTVGGVVLAIIVGLTLVSLYPVKILLIGLGVSLYLLGKKLKKN